MVKAGGVSYAYTPVRRFHETLRERTNRHYSGVRKGPGAGQDPNETPTRETATVRHQIDLWAGW